VVFVRKDPDTERLYIDCRFFDTDTASRMVSGFFIDKAP
jgi:hypothetical protein